MSLSYRAKNNLEIQGFRCDASQFEAIELWLRFNPVICFFIAAFGLYYASPATFFALSLIAAVGVIFPHAVGDSIYNYGIRFFTGGPSLPPNPPPRRFACFVGMAWSGAIAFAFTYGYVLIAYVLGAIFLMVIIPMVVWHYCIASLIYQKIIGYRPS